MDAAGLLALHGTKSQDLAHALRERGDLLGRAIRIHSDTWEGAYDLGVTERREACKTATSRIYEATAKLDGEIDAYRAELNGLEQALKYGTTGGSDG